MTLGGKELTCFINYIIYEMTVNKEFVHVLSSMIVTFYRLRRGSQTTKSGLTSSSSFNQDPTSSFVEVDSDEDLSENS